MNILITGGAGFIGSHLCQRLLGSGHSVVSLDSFDPFYHRDAKERNNLLLSSFSRFRFDENDVNTPGVLKNILIQNQIEVVYHLAGRGGVPQSSRDPQKYLNEIVRGTMATLEGCVGHRDIKLFINASSSSVYGETGSAECIESHAADRPCSIYAALKRASELICHAYHRLNGLGVVNARLFSVYGPRGRPDQIIYKLVELIDRNRPIPLIAPDPTRDFTYIDDIVDALERMLLLPRDCYEVINLGNGSPTSITAIIQMIAAVLGKKPVFGDAIAPPLSDVSSSCANTARAQDILGWKPQVPIEEGVRRFVEWYLEEGVSN